ncbi:cobalamin biosynthesis protein CobD [Lysinibacillus fusiformis]|jgi:adenosylcobinamide-phosphate synthase|uniref:adenosylcobinamide-phosphate synthase CbiB n=1 Tax=Lysinibacillus TaxID=400634 RepID=UPI0004D5CC6B|nr:MULTISPECIES: adenosylcobinamide-phosphate synthase CbiB [Lysinibacillus]MDC6266419.1 adenosylcobinamide-phosphate synthase CbiB [Lysinibacillus sphaericus]AJK88179.1 cobalamin biosynthesis protein CobD [Lysinibacillus fusiformis]KAB0442818.1 cobalamin biosynthesis protein CobD [Lysinibacillus fusiformis]KGA84081.1 cobalamin biosynthesis protein CobD [Lysinibacillus fusiformis]KHK50097.1 cobalamin biosynthesis protein CobD [Lysinibacillus sp. A1]
MIAIVIACIIGIIFDILVGDPPKLPHPVRWIGKLIQSQTALWNQGKWRKLRGMVMALAVVGTTMFVVTLILLLSYQVSLIFGVLVEGLLIGIGLAQRSLKEAALAVYEPLVKGDFAEARIKLSWIVGRDTEKLGEDEIVRGVVETVSENTSDGVTAPLFYAFLFGAIGLWGYKAVNTLDSMVGYKNETYKDFGMFSAKLDDVLNFIPSRITGFLIVLGTKNETSYSFGQRLKRWAQDAKKHPSPNSGYLEAATAVQLGVQLGGKNTYQGIVSHRAIMGEKLVPLTKEHIMASIIHMRIAMVLFTLVMLAVEVFIYAIT